LLERADGGALRLHRLLGVFVQAVAQDGDAQTAVEQSVYELANQLNHGRLPVPFLIIQGHLRYITDQAMERDDERAASLCRAYLQTHKYRRMAPIVTMPR
jgi:hypothetical protein